MSVNARFWVREFIRYGNTDNIRVVLAPVVRAKPMPGAEDNVDWSKYTPSGEISLNITTEGAQAWFEERVGKDIAITFADPEG
jgi:hypothetical protein